MPDWRRWSPQSAHVQGGRLEGVHEGKWRQLREGACRPSRMKSDRGLSNATPYADHPLLGGAIRKLRDSQVGECPTRNDMRRAYLTTGFPAQSMKRWSGQEELGTALRLTAGALAGICSVGAFRDLLVTRPSPAHMAFNPSLHLPARPRALPPVHRHSEHGRAPLSDGRERRQDDWRRRRRGARDLGHDAQGVCDRGRDAGALVGRHDEGKEAGVLTRDWQSRYRGDRSRRRALRLAQLLHL